MITNIFLICLVLVLSFVILALTLLYFYVLARLVSWAWFKSKLWYKKEKEGIYGKEGQEERQAQ